MADYSVQYIQGLLGQGLNATQGLAALRASGGRSSTQAWYRAWGEVQASLSAQTIVGQAPLDRRPTAQELTRMTTVSAKGFIYRGELLVRPLGTNEVQTTAASLRSDTLITYGDALDQLTQTFADSRSGQGFDVIGGTLTEVNILDPGEF